MTKKNTFHTKRPRGITRCAGLLPMLMLPAALLAQPPQPAQEQLTLDQAVALALKGNRDVMNARLEIEKSANDVAIARSYRRPTFDLNVFEGQFLAPVNFTVPAGTWGVYPATGPIPATAANITTPAHPFTIVQAKASETVSRWHGTTLGIRLRGLLRDEASEKLRAQQLEVVDQVRRLYYGIVGTQSAMAANQAAAATLREQDRVATESVARQTALKSTELDVKARIARVDYEAATLQHDLAAQKEQLNDVMGRDVRTEYTVSALPDTAPATPDLTAGLTRALTERPEVREARLKIQQAQTDHDMKKTEFIPEVTFDVQFFSAYRINLLPQNVGAVGFTVKWDVFDWGRRRKELANKSLVIDQAGIALKSVESQVTAEVETQYRKVEDGQRLLDVVKTAQNAGREKVRIASERHSLDAALTAELMEAQASLAETDRQYQQALASYLSALADFDKATAAP